MTDSALTFRPICPSRDGDIAYQNYRDACIESFGSDLACSESIYLEWLARRIEEFPDGQVMAQIGHRLVGQLEIQVPYGSKTGYVNLFYIAPLWRRMGIGRKLHHYADRYLHSWEATAVELHVSPANQPAVKFYRSIGYCAVLDEGGNQRVWKMRREISVQAR